jgi:acyl-coenzyme A thioesterase PaaI-like protein
VTSSGLPHDHPMAGPNAKGRLMAAFAELSTTEHDPSRTARWAAADVLRRAIDELITSDAPAEAVVEAVDLVERAAELLASQPHGRSYAGVAEGSMSGDSRTFVDFSPLAGRSNPLAPPLVIELLDDRVIGRGSFGAAYEGPPGCVHGGFIAAAFDEVLGFAQSLSGPPGMTGRLTISYRSPTPLGEPLVFSGRVDSVSGRKISTSATLHHGDTLCAEADGLFISVDPAVFERLLQQRG